MKRARNDLARLANDPPKTVDELRLTGGAKRGSLFPRLACDFVALARVFAPSHPR